MTALPRPETSLQNIEQQEVPRLEEKMAPSAIRSSSTFLILLIVLVLPLSRLIPPFQSPDEFNHVKRAYLLSKGHVFFETKDGESGGDIDGGLLDYMNIFESIPFGYHEKVTQKMLHDSKKITWTHKAQFSPLPNTAVYFPLSYIPQAAAMLIGELSGLSINDTYYLARAFSLLATIAMLWAAMRTYPVPLLVCALFATPMALFQMGSASLDAISFSMSVLAASLFMRMADDHLPFNKAMRFALLFCLLLLVTTRANLIGLIWLPLISPSTRRTHLYLISSCILIVLSISWIVFAVLTVQGPGIQIQNMSAMTILLYYFKHLDQLFHVMYSTLASGTLLLSYWRMFIGVLGWIDTPLDWAVYWGFAIAFGTLTVISVPTSGKALLSPARVSLALGAALSTLLLFLVFLATFTLHPANFIGAIQGRYFYPMVIFLGFALFDHPMPQSRIKIGRVVVFLMLVLSTLSMAPKLIDRYWAS